MDVGLPLLRSFVLFVQQHPVGFAASVSGAFLGSTYYLRSRENHALLMRTQAEMVKKTQETAQCCRQALRQLDQSWGNDLHLKDEICRTLQLQSIAQRRSLEHLFEAVRDCPLVRQPPKQPLVEQPAVEHAAAATVSVADDAPAVQPSPPATSGLNEGVMASAEHVTPLDDPTEWRFHLPSWSQIISASWKEPSPQSAAQPLMPVESAPLTQDVSAAPPPQQAAAPPAQGLAASLPEGVAAPPPPVASQPSEGAPDAASNDVQHPEGIAAPPPQSVAAPPPPVAAQPSKAAPSAASSDVHTPKANEAAAKQSGS